MFPMEKLGLEKLSVKPLSTFTLSPQNNTDSDLNSALLKSVTCGVSSCNGYVYPPIKQCRSGHCLCFECNQISQSVCPECSAPIIPARNLALEKIAPKLLTACSYRSEGCHVAMPLSYNMKSHEKECIFRTYACYFGKCTWKGHSHQILKHMQDKHKERVFMGSEKVFSIKKLDNREELEMMFVFSCQFGDFIVKLIYKKSDAMFYGAVQYLGNTDMAKQFKYCFQSIVSNTYSEKHLKYVRSTHTDNTNFEMIFQHRDCFCAPIDIAKYFAVSDTFTINLSITYIGKD